MKSNKTTDTVQDVETRLQAELLLIKDPKVAVDIKKNAAKKANFYINHLGNVDGKEINGKDYNKRMYHSDNKPMNKEEIIELMDSVNIPYDKQHEETKMDMELRGIFMSKPQT